jgi:transcriptional regulator with XRE-family HTH domain
LTQTDLARLSDTTQASIARVETGETQSPRSSVLAAIARALSTTTDYLTGSSDDPGPLPTPAPLELTPPSNEMVVEYESTTTHGATISTYGAQAWYPPMQTVARAIKPVKPAWTWRDVRHTHPARSSRVQVTPRMLADLAQFYWENYPPPPDAEELEEEEKRRK